MHSSQVILDSFITVHATRTWKDWTFDFDAKSEIPPIIATEHTWGASPANYIEIINQWFFIKYKTIYEITSNLHFQHSFHFKNKFTRKSRVYTNQTSNPPVGVIHTSQVHRYDNSRVCNHLDYQTDNKVSYFIAQNSKVIGVLYLPYEHNPTKRYPVAKISSDSDLQDIAPALVSFCLAEEYGQRYGHNDIGL